jgi:hypothetical protein
MATKISLGVHIVNTLEKHLNDDNHFITIEEIAREIFGDTVFEISAQTGRHFHNLLINKIKQSMNQAHEVAADNDMIIIPRRLSTQKNPSLKSRIFGYKIATKGDETYLREELIYKNRKGNEHLQSLNRLADDASQKNLIPSHVVKKLPKPTEEILDEETNQNNN